MLITLIEARSTTAICSAFGTFTKTRDPSTLELKRFRMSSQFHLAEQLARGRINRRQRAIAESDIQPLGHRVVSHVVRVVAEPNDSSGSIVVRTKQLQTLTLPVGDGYGPRVRRDGDPLWLTESRQAS